MPLNSPMSSPRIFFGNVKDLFNEHLVRLEDGEVVFLEKSIVHYGSSKAMG